MKWHRDKESPAAIYDSIDRRYSIVWDPSGWHLWEGAKLLGVFPTLNAAKDGVRDTEQEPSAEPDTREAVSADDLGDAIG